MTAITIDIPNADVGFFTKMISKMGWSLSGASITKRPATGKEKTLKRLTTPSASFVKCRTDL